MLVNGPSFQPGEWARGKMIGSGSFGVVHLAINKSNDSLFVVKSSDSHEWNQSLENEANILEALDSPHIVRCHGKHVSCGEKGHSKINLFVEYMAVGSLSDVMEKLEGKLDEQVIRVYTREILIGLKYLHDIGIVHGDVKCQNNSLGELGASNQMSAILKIVSSNERPSFPRGFSDDGLDFLRNCLVRIPERRPTIDALLKNPFMNMQQKRCFENMYSPLSVLDIGLDDDGCESVEMKLPFSVRHYEKSQKQCTENETASQENWVTVRS
ncbi:hypothetical protein L1987_74322 [Smallanthus sonchifolius]|uniref:Uncharacterized protein n=1 Tax=Smallanthus sonchifolius TaxID=185202 RepID=A0ACB9A389_9ASTR|nr:hypothetical protein L1987_74322 [Smallanthus sonchifolius]